MEMVRVRLRKPRRVFIFLSENVPVRRDDACIVRTERGLEWGTCILPPEPCPKEMEKRYTNRLVRTADDSDHKTQDELVTEENRAMQLCAKKIAERNLPMKMVDAEMTFDKQKFIFYFTADDRVDFRELVRDLAHDLRSRIELRHIQVRDEAKMVGGLGMCGRQLCCSTWLDEFKPISMRMAKKQNLSLNPSKISGQCGRLLCCLEYENDLYGEAKRRVRETPQENTERREEEQQPRRRTFTDYREGEWVDEPKTETPDQRPRRDNRPEQRRDDRPRQGERPQGQRPQGERPQAQRPQQPGNAPRREAPQQRTEPRPEAGPTQGGTPPDTGDRPRGNRGGRRRNNRNR